MDIDKVRSVMIEVQNLIIDAPEEEAPWERHLRATYRELSNAWAFYEAEEAKIKAVQASSAQALADAEDIEWMEV